MPVGRSFLLLLTVGTSVWANGCSTSPTTRSNVVGDASPAVTTGAPPSVRGSVASQKSARAESPPHLRVLTLLQTDKTGRRSIVAAADQWPIERELLARFQSAEPPLEVFALEAFYYGGGPGSVIDVTVRGGASVVRWQEADREDRCFNRSLTEEEFSRSRVFVATSGADALPPLLDRRGTVSSTCTSTPCRSVRSAP
ncbi:MAG: hypothetical protein JWO31_223 [Phycisphaerales bacterium]|nr:hypothetical protein [Phycisphaerales bacterium]